MKLPGRSQWPKRIGWLVLFLIAAVLILVGGSLAILSTPWGSERLRKIAESKINEAIKGRVSIGKVQFTGRHLTLKSLEVHDPDSELVAQVESIDVEIALLPLIHKTVRLTKFGIVRPRLFMEQDQHGLNLAWAFEPKVKPSSTAGATQPTTWLLELDRLAIHQGDIAFSDQQAGSTHIAHIRDLELSLQAKSRLDFEVFKTALQVDGTVIEPVSGRLSVNLTAQGHGDQRKGDVKLSLDGAELSLTAEMSGSQNIQAHLEKLQMPERVARSVFEQYPLRRTANVKGDIRKIGDLVEAEIQASAGRAQATLSGRADISRFEVLDLLVHAHGVDLSELLEDGPKSRLELSLRGRGGGQGLESAQGDLQLTIPRSAVGDAEIGPVQIDAHAYRGNFSLAQFFVQVPGATLRAEGKGTTERLQLSGILDARNLAKVSRLIHAVGLPKIEFGGAGRLQFHVAGPVRHASASVNGAFHRLTFQQNEVQGLLFSANVPNVTRPLESKVTVGLDSSKVGGKRTGPIHLRLASENRQLLLTLLAQRPFPLSLRLAGVLDRDDLGILLSTFNFDYPEAKWRLSEKSHLRFEGDSLLVDSLHLVSGRQSIYLDAQKRLKRVQAKVSVGGFDLSQLPRAFFDSNLNLEGLIDASISMTGMLDRPNLTVSFELRQGRIHRYSGLGCKLEAHYARDRAQGRFTAEGEGLNLDSTFLLPIQAIKNGLREPVELIAQLKEADLSKVLPNFGFKDRVLGSVYASAKIIGLADDPRLELTIGGHDVTYMQLPAADFTFTAKSAKSGQLEANFETRASSRTNRMSLKTPFSLARLIRRTPTVPQLLHAVYELDADLQELPIPLPYTARFEKKQLWGNVSAKAKIRGSPLAPVGNVEVLVSELTTGLSAPIDARINLMAKVNEVEARVLARHNHQEIVQLEARLHSAPAQLASLNALAAAPISLRGRVGPLAVADLQQLLESETTEWGQPREIKFLDGIVSLSLEAQGSLRDPRLDLEAVVEGLGMQKGNAAGDIHLQYQYRNAQNHLMALVQPSDGGKLEMNAAAKLDLSFPGILQQVAISDIDIDAKLAADDVNLAFLSGVIPQITQLEGRLAASATLKGKPTAPIIQGEMELKGGRVSLGGSGDFRDIHLALKGDPNRIELSDLSAKVGRGDVKVRAEATRQGQGYALRTDASAKKLPIISDDQLLATVTTKTHLEGNVSPKLIDLTKVQVLEAHIELPDVKRKDLQELAEAKNIYFIRHGKLVTQGAPAQALGTGGSASPTATSTPTVRANIVAPRNLWVRGNDVNAELGLKEGFRVEYRSEPFIYGRLNVIRGRADVYGRRFDLVPDSKVDFAGPIKDLNLDISAKYVNDIQKVTVLVHVTGGPSSLKIDPTSEPPMTQTEILTLLATGRPTLKPGSGTASSGGAAASIVGYFAAGQLKKTLSDKLPLDVLSIEAGDKGLSGTKLEAGTYLSPRLYVGFTGRIGAADPTRTENNNAVKMEYQLSKRWSVGAEYGDARVGGADLFWSKEY